MPTTFEMLNSLYSGLKNGMSLEYVFNNVSLHFSSIPALFIDGSFIWFSSPLSVLNCFL
ncbi:MAG: hypothetical protein C5S48_09585 [Candidatus Methanogaster sp.]|nr:MAG: hypothetical protein C5S48_09585 [ANME-2 cluster archaeon]